MPRSYFSPCLSRVSGSLRPQQLDFFLFSLHYYLKNRSEYKQRSSLCSQSFHGLQASYRLMMKTATGIQLCCQQTQLLLPLCASETQGGARSGAPSRHATGRVGFVGFRAGDV